MMRCSSRERDILCPSFITSTPIPKCRESYPTWASCLSPITETAAFATISLARASRNKPLRYFAAPNPSNTTARKQRTFAPLVVCSSDSEEETISSNNMPISRKSSKIVSKAESSRSTETRQRREVSLKEHPSNLVELPAENKKGSHRVSRVDAILDEIIKENLKPTNAGPNSPEEKKCKSHESMDALIEKEVTLNSPYLTRMTRSSYGTTLAAVNKETLAHHENFTKDTRIDIEEYPNLPDKKLQESVPPKLNKREGYIREQAETIKDKAVVNEAGNNIDHKGESSKVINNKDVTEMKVSKPTKRQPKRSTKAPSLVNNDKENLVKKIVNGSHEVDVFIIKEKTKPETIAVKLEDPVDSLKLNNLSNRKRRPEGKLEIVSKKTSLSPDSLRMRTFINELGNQSSSEDKELEIFNPTQGWKQTKSNAGVFIDKKIVIHQSSIGYIKIEAKSSFKKTSSSDQMFTIIEGAGFIIIDDKKMKVNSGDMLKVPSGCEYEIQNRGRTKALVMSYIIWK